MKSNLEHFFKVSYTEEGDPIVELGEETKLQKLHQRVYMESGEWVHWTEPIEQIEYNGSLVYLCTNLILYSNRDISLRVHEPGEALDRDSMPLGAKLVFFRVCKHEICFFIRGIEIAPNKTTVSVYIPFDEGHLELWSTIRKYLIDDKTVASAIKPQRTKIKSDTPKEDQQIKTTVAHYGVTQREAKQEQAAQLMGTSSRSYRKYRDKKWLLSEQDFKRITYKTIAQYWEEMGGR